MREQAAGTMKRLGYGGLVGGILGAGRRGESTCFLPIVHVTFLADRTARSMMIGNVNSAFHPSRVGKSSTGLTGWGGLSG